MPQAPISTWISATDVIGSQNFQSYWENVESVMNAKVRKVKEKILGKLE